MGRFYGAFESIRAPEDEWWPEKFIRSLVGHVRVAALGRTGLVSANGARSGVAGQGRVFV